MVGELSEVAYGSTWRLVCVWSKFSSVFGIYYLSKFLPRPHYTLENSSLFLIPVLDHSESQAKLKSIYFFFWSKRNEGSKLWHCLIRITSNNYFLIELDLHCTARHRWSFTYWEKFICWRKMSQGYCISNPRTPSCMYRQTVGVFMGPKEVKRSLEACLFKPVLSFP